MTLHKQMFIALGGTYPPPPGLLFQGFLRDDFLENTCDFNTPDAIFSLII
ncbi:hypothetical protein ACMZ87_06380 [Gardnerella pickettii]